MASVVALADTMVTLGWLSPVSQNQPIQTNYHLFLTSCLLQSARPDFHKHVSMTACWVCWRGGEEGGGWRTTSTSTKLHPAPPQRAPEICTTSKLNVQHFFAAPRCGVHSHQGVGCTATKVWGAQPPRQTSNKFGWKKTGK